MIGLFSTVIFLAVGYLCQYLPSDIKQDISNIIYNLPVAFKDCSKTKVLLSHLKFTLYAKNLENGTHLDNTNLEMVDPHNRLIFIIHGWLQTGSESWIIEMKDAYLKQTAANIIVVDWSLYAGINYASASCAVPEVGSFVGDLICKLVTKERAHLKNIQINGFSLGAHVGGFAGQKVQDKTHGSKIDRINGLDAAGPGFLDLPLNKRLDRSDASFVQGIHTSNYQFGYTPSYATVDFHVNYKTIPGCGAVQYGCPFTPGIPIDNVQNVEKLLPYVFCNHVRAVAYFIESISSSNFISAPCTSCKAFGQKQCKSSPITMMGEHCPSTVSGEYYLTTNAEHPFAKGSAGIK